MCDKGCVDGWIGGNCIDGCSENLIYIFNFINIWKLLNILYLINFIIMNIVSFNKKVDNE